MRGVDPSQALIREATARVGLDPEGRVAFKVGRAASLPYPDGFFDLVAVLDTRSEGAELARVLSPGGHLILVRTSPQRGPFAETPARLRRRLARHGIEPVKSAAAGAGNFFIGRLRDRS